MIVSSASRFIDFDRASYLMDQGLLQQARRKHIRDMTENRQPDAIYGLGYIWALYCEYHHKKYGTPFEPDVSLTWDT
jgi:hypothetical protein